MLKKIKILILILKLNYLIVYSLKPISFCILNQQECKRVYNELKHAYEIKCESIKCHGTFSYECGSRTCSKNKTECNEFNLMNSYINILNEKQKNDSKFKYKYLKETIKLKKFYDYIPNCKNKTYEFDSNDFCLNNNYNETDCKLPINQSFICDKYCAKDSIACDYFKSNYDNNNKEYIIKYCLIHHDNYSNDNIIHFFHIGFFICITLFSSIFLLIYCKFDNQSHY